MAKSKLNFHSFLMTFYHLFRRIFSKFIPKYLSFKSVKNELVLITGGGNGLGRILAVRFAKLGSHIILLDIDKLGLKETVDLVEKEYPSVKCLSFFCDITDRSAVYGLAKRIKDELGTVSILVNNAGFVNGMNFLELPDEKIIQTFNVNVISHFWTIKAFLPDMITNNKGHLVTIASIAGLFGGCKLTDYCASKFACVGFEEGLRLELQKFNLQSIKTTIALPYFIDTGMFAGCKSTILPALKTEYVADQIMASILSDEEFVVIPKFLNILIFLKSIIPVSAFNKFIIMMGGLQFMEDFIGRHDKLNQ